MDFTLYRSDFAGVEANCRYPRQQNIRCAEDLKAAAAFDHVCVAFKDFYRKRENFLSADVLVMDCDNTHSENPANWMNPEKLLNMLPKVSVAVVPSRNHMKPKEGKCARPRFHVYFGIPDITDEQHYAELKRAIHRAYPFFDEAALDAARFIYGCPVEKVLWQDGETTIDQVLKVGDTESRSIPAGRRNSTMSRFAGRVIKRYGATEKAYQIFLDEAEKCDPPLPDEELNHIWQSAVRFGEKIAKQVGYINPEQYNNDFGTKESLKPEDYTDIGQAKVLVREYGNELKYTPATGYLRYDGKRWIESKSQAIGAAEEFLDLQLNDAKDNKDKTMKALLETGINEAAIRKGGSALEKLIDNSVRPIYYEYLGAVSYEKFVLKRRDIKYILTALTAAMPMIEIPYDSLDSDPFLLNCPDGTYDLRQGIRNRYEHRAEDLLTKMTAAAPGDEGKKLWLDSLNQTFQGNQELIDYVQMITGLAAIGQVELEAMIISYGEGANGKSTFWNTVAGVLGSYSGTLSADALTANCKRNVKPELAEAKGKRLLIAAELEEGMRLSTSIVKQLCSTDKISAEKKYKDPSDFTPSHTLVLYTNHLPRVGAMDAGIWRRLIVIPFTATISKKRDIKNYAGYLMSHAAPYVLKWVMEGAEKAIQCSFTFPQPACVKEAVQQYRNDNDWMTHFLDECCDVSPSLHEKSGKLYEEYRSFCQRNGDFARSSIEFTKTLEQRGFIRKRKKDGRFIIGLQLRITDFLD